IFYGWWDWRFLSLIALSTLVDYVCGLKIEGAKSQRTRRWWLMASMVSNLGMLGFFKYFNFFVQNLDRVLGPLGLSMDLTIASIVLPVGISFYTFQTMSYTIDIYRGELKPTRDFLNFALFVSFFPQLVAGPIERAKALLPQIETPRVVKYSQVRQGLRFILYGYIMK
ncbi:MAG: MBOAT family protein, partial [Planctomycetales bacterium]|nr:MBOAT family protein [Planctomycetales bacterium]